MYTVLLYSVHSVSIHVATHGHYTVYAQMYSFLIHVHMCMQCHYTCTQCHYTQCTHVLSLYSVHVHVCTRCHYTVYIYTASLYISYPVSLYIVAIRTATIQCTQYHYTLYTVSCTIKFTHMHTCDLMKYQLTL